MQGMRAEECRQKQQRLGEVADDFTTLHTREIILVDEERLDHDKNLVDIRPDPTWESKILMKVRSTKYNYFQGYGYIQVPLWRSSVI